jgi:hypothetical protein
MKTGIELSTVYGEPVSSMTARSTPSCPGYSGLVDQRVASVQFPLTGSSQNAVVWPPARGTGMNATANRKQTRNDARSACAIRLVMFHPFLWMSESAQ